MLKSTDKSNKRPTKLLHTVQHIKHVKSAKRTHLSKKLSTFSTTTTNSVQLPSRDEKQQINSLQDSYSRIVAGPRLVIPEINLVERLITHASNPNKPFFRTLQNRSVNNNSANNTAKIYTYTHLLHHSLQITSKIQNVLKTLENSADSIDLTKNPPSASKMGHRVCILAPNSFEYSSYTMATWMSGAVAVPLHVEHPAIEMVHYLSESEAAVLVTHPHHKKQAEEVLTLYHQQSNGKNCTLVELDEFDGYYTQENQTNIAHDAKLDNSVNSTDKKAQFNHFGPFSAENTGNKPQDDFTKILSAEKSTLIVKKSIFASIPSLVTKNRQDMQDLNPYEHSANENEISIPEDNDVFDSTMNNTSDIEIHIPSADSPALFIFTSGTTGKAKAVVLSHKNILTNIRGMIQEWNWSSTDHILDLLPKHHIHGVVNVLYTSMWVGSRVTSLGMQKLDTKAILNHLMSLPIDTVSENANMNVSSHQQEHIMVTKKDFIKLAQRPHFTTDITLESGHSSRKIPALRHYPNNYDITTSLQLLEEGWDQHNNNLSTLPNVPPDLPVPTNESYSLFMAVPTIYHKLIDTYNNDFDPTMQRKLTLAFSQFRLMVSGSMALPRTTLEKWKMLSGHTLLERYGMSEIGMALTNKYMEVRHPGAVGWPFGGVSVCVQIKQSDDYDNSSHNNKDEHDANSQRSQSNEISPQDSDVFGELLVQGHSVFGHYFNRLDKTEESFIDICPTAHPSASQPSNFNQDNPFKPIPQSQDLSDGLYPQWAATFQDLTATQQLTQNGTQNKWFLTGDIARIDKNNCVSLLGRSSVDILKVSGYKISALDVERVLLDHPGIQTLAVVGLDDEATGQSIAAIIVPNSKWVQEKRINTQNNDANIDLEDIVQFALDKMPKYKLPRKIILTDHIPTNAMGKINKKHLVKWILEQEQAKL